MIDVLSLGAGVQSSVLWLMSCRGDLPKLRCGIFADTQYEPKAVYAHLDWLERVGREAGIPCHRVSVGNLREDALDFREHRASADGKRFASIPLYIRNGDGSPGVLPRQCTSDYKIEPIERFIRREILGLKPRQRAPKEVVVRQWMGITTDEIQRVKGPTRKVRRKQVVTVETLFGPREEVIEVEDWETVHWKTHCFPFCDLELWPDRSVMSPGLLPRMTRRDCLEWLARHYPERQVPRSACLCCPYRSNAEWRYLRDTDPDGWADACEFDRQVRLRHAAGQASRKVLKGLPFVHRSLVPLAQVDLDADGDDLFGMVNECEGMCGV